MADFFAQAGDLFAERVGDGGSGSALMGARPGVELFRKGEDGAAGAGRGPANGESKIALPSLHGAHAPAEVETDFLP